MQILTVDVGTGTQDILLFDSERELENCFKLVLPSPTVVIADRVRAATAQRRAVVLDGVTMGGGPCHWATMDHVRAGLPAYATPEAARTFDDDLAAVAEMGIRVISEDEALVLADGGAACLSLRDLWFGPLIQTLVAFGVKLRLDALAVAVFDHGAAPPGVSDRVFRFDYLRDRLASGLGLAGFAFPREQIPASMTRLQAVDQTAPRDLPLLVMDTAPAAVLGALDDPVVAGCHDAVVANVGNFHCLAFHLRAGQVAGLFEHHTGELSPERLRRYVEQLSAGSISNQEVYADKGHGALVLGEPGHAASFVAVTGPRRGLLTASGLDTYLAVPHADMMLTGNFGLLRAFAAYDRSVRGAVEQRLGSEPSAR
jgi:uncharacterized protein (DUF1786 family)